MLKHENNGLKSMFNFPLHIHTATMFIVLTVALGAGQIWFNYQKNTELIRDGASVAYEKVMQKVHMDLKAKYYMAATSIEIIAEGGLVNALTLDERLKFVPVLSKILNSNIALSGFEIGYSNGDFFIIRPVHTEYMREQFKAPIGTLFMIDNINRLSTDKNPTVRIYYDKNLNIVSQKSILDITYDPRTRPWYKLAMASEGYATTLPYLYFFVKKVGITITLESKSQGTVVAADIALDDLSATLRNNIITPSSELVLFDKHGKILAYKDPHKLIVEDQNGKSKIASIAELQSPVLTRYADQLVPFEQPLSFSFMGGNWGGGIKKFDISKDFELYFAFIAPDDELFAEALEIRWQSSLIALLLMLIAVPVTAYSAYRISEPLRKLTIQARKIRQFDFSQDSLTTSVISEIHTLTKDMEGMRTTISHFLSMITSLAGEKNLDSLLATITRQTLEISRADAAILYLLNEEGTKITPVSIKLAADGDKKIVLPSHDMKNSNEFIVKSIQQRSAEVHYFKRCAAAEREALGPFFTVLDTENLQVLTLSLKNRLGEIKGILCVINNANNATKEDLDNVDRISFLQTLSGFAAVSMESRHLLKAQKELLGSFIKLIAGAIDAKSHYTAGHCQRVPELTKMLAEQACKQTSGEFKDFYLSKEEWEELDIAAWLHDCGKITTPEYVVDKATKLETIYDRIHEIRMRFEVLKRDAEIDYWQRVSSGGDERVLQKILTETLAKIDTDFKFVANCNIGCESMSEEKIQRVKQLAKITWRRTISDRIGVSWEEGLRKDKAVEQPLPVMEQLIVDKVEHIIERHHKDVLSANNKWGFNMQTPKHQYNRGELYNLCIAKGTLNTEERYKVNEHIIQTIIMLDALKFPVNLSRVLEIAGGHHEKMDGTGYPKRLGREEMSTSARMMAIADIFEALTAHDRPYKKAKKLSQAISIMSVMKKDNHIDGPLFDLFLHSGIYLEYARKNLSAEQIDLVDINKYL
ncbi:MAG: hypothetical protein OFPII_38660 [Osedax symbiont Rs1]|nr:MAG: hypothetical protein OFPII_38660 [Osedax symbiont Rs1]